MLLLLGQWYRWLQMALPVGVENEVAGEDEMPEMPVPVELADSSVSPSTWTLLQWGPLLFNFYDNNIIMGDFNAHCPVWYSYTTSTLAECRIKRSQQSPHTQYTQHTSGAILQFNCDGISSFLNPSYSIHPTHIRCHFTA